MSRVKVNFRKGFVIRRVKEATDEALWATALAIEGEAKQNVVANDQVDTGFMLNSGYSIGVGGRSDERQAWRTGEYGSRQSGKSEHRKRAPNPGLPGGDVRAAVVWGAVYSFWQELLDPFILPAFHSINRRLGGVMEPVFRRKI